MQSIVQGAVDRGVELGICSWASTSLTPACLRTTMFGVRGRLIAIVIALAVLAFAETRYDDQGPTAQRQSNAASGQLADPPVPGPDLPAIITAAVSTSATFQTVVVIESRRQLSPALSVFTVSPHPPLIAHSAREPRFFPLLI